MLSGVEKAQREERAAEMLRQVGLEHRLRHYPSEMSGGEQQRTAVARALIHKPALVLADEPTGNLDSKTGAEVMDLLHTLNEKQGITLVVVTHDADVAAYAGRTVHLRDGQIAEITHKKTAVPVPQGGDHEAALPNDPGRLRAADILHSAFRNLGRRPVRNLLTAGGVLIGIITLVAMVSFGVGVQREVQRNFATIGLENIFVRPRFAEGDGFDPFADFEAATPITPEIVDEIRRLPQVASVTPELALPQSLDITITVGDQSLPVRVSDSFGEARFGFGARNEPLAGESLDEGESAGVVLVAGLADGLLLEGEIYEDLVGAPVIFTLQLPRGEQQEFFSSIVGVRDSFGRRTVDLGLAERAAMKAWWFGQPDIVEMEGYDALTVKATDLAFVPDLIEGIEELDLQTQSLEAVLDVANQVLTLLQVLLGSVGGLALLVAALGVANTMMMAIYERTREIGVLKALGAARGEIRAMFTVEAAFIGLIGGFFGLIFGALCWGVSPIGLPTGTSLAKGITGVGDLSVIPPWLALGSLVFAALIGILAGLYPAARAARLDPVAALRHE